MIRLLFLLPLVAVAQYNTPPDVIQFLRDVGSDLANAHPQDPIHEPYASARAFLDHFDSSMPGFDKLREYVEELASRAEIGSNIEIVEESGDDHKREMTLDWVLEINDKTMQQQRPPRRQLIKCTIEKKGKKWKFTAFEPIEFFKY